MESNLLHKISRLVGVILNAGCILSGVAAAGCLLGAVSLVGTSIFVPNNGIKQTFEGAVTESGHPLSYTGFVLFTVSCAVIFVCLFLALLYSRKLFRCLQKNNSPFTSQASSQIRKIAFWGLLFSMFPMWPIKSFHFSSAFIGIVFALILFCISLVWDYGCDLQKEVDEIL